MQVTTAAVNTALARPPRSAPVDGISIIIPAYEEERGLAGTLQKLEAAAAALDVPVEVIVVDDGSRDRTGAIALESGAIVCRHDRNRGYGAALKTGIRQATYDVIAISDADGSYPCEQIPQLVALMGEYDMVVGSRTGATVQMPVLRKPAKWVLARFANYVANMKIPDLNSGLRVFRRQAAMEFFHMLPDGFSFTTTLTMAMLTSSYNVAYVPIDYHRRTGRSKIQPIADTINFFGLVARMALYFRPLRVFLPFALFFALLSGGKLIYDAFVYNFSLRGTTLALLVITLQLFLLALVADLIVAQRRVR